MAGSSRKCTESSVNRRYWRLWSRALPSNSRNLTTPIPEKLTARHQVLIISGHPNPLCSNPSDADFPVMARSGESQSQEHFIVASDMSLPNWSANDDSHAAVGTNQWSQRAGIAPLISSRATTPLIFERLFETRAALEDPARGRISMNLVPVLPSRSARQSSVPEYRSYCSPIQSVRSIATHDHIVYKAHSSEWRWPLCRSMPVSVSLVVRRLATSLALPGTKPVSYETSLVMDAVQIALNEKPRSKRSAIYVKIEMLPSAFPSLVVREEISASTQLRPAQEMTRK